MSNPVDYAHGTQTASIGTEHFVSSPNVAGTFVCTFDLDAMAAGDVVEIRAYKMALTGGTARVLYFETYQDAQPADAKMVQAGPIGNTLTDTNSLRFSIKQTGGTGRNFPWVVEQYT